mgnify:CR=1 FL=1
MLRAGPHERFNAHGHIERVLGGDEKSGPLVHAPESLQSQVVKVAGRRSQVASRKKQKRRKKKTEKKKTEKPTHANHGAEKRVGDASSDQMNAYHT